MKSLIFVLLLSLAVAQECERKERKATAVRRRNEYPFIWSEDSEWWNKWASYYEYITLYNFTICKNVTLEAAKPLEVVNASSDNVKTIFFIESTIPIVPVGVFSHFSNATKLYLNNSWVKTIQQGAFSGMNSLEDLYLQDNQIELLERGVLNHLTKLRILDLSRNTLKVLESNALLGLLSLTELYVKQNQLEDDTFGLKFCSNLEIFDFSANSFENFDFETLSGLKKLHTILLNKNRLVQISFNNFINLDSKHLPKLKFLDASFNEIDKVNLNVSDLRVLNISHNKISFVGNWTNFHSIDEIDCTSNNISNLNDPLGPRVKKLYLSKNNITNLTSFLCYSDELVELDVSKNKIADVNFHDLSKLQQLALNNNQIKRLNVGCFKNLSNLKQLNLSGNSLSSFHFGTFDSLANLEELYLDHNEVAGFEENSFHALAKLKILFLDHNVIATINIEHLLHHLKNLRKVTLAENDWNCRVLFETVKAFKDADVEVIPGDVFKSENIFGIRCNKKEASETNYTAFNFMSVANSSFYKFFSTLNATFVNYFESKKKESSNTEALQGYFRGLTNLNKELIKQFQTFSNRVIGFISIMVTILVAIILIFTFIFIKPDIRKTTNRNHTNTPNNTNFIRNDLELRQF